MRSAASQSMFRNGIPQNCIQCNFCSYVCPHAVIRPVALTEEEAANAPAGMKYKDMTGMPGYEVRNDHFRDGLHRLRFLRTRLPGHEGREGARHEAAGDPAARAGRLRLWPQDLARKPEVIDKFKETTVKGSQFKQPLLEFSGACAGCGETPYAKLVTQLFGDRMYIANATGCSSIWGGSAPSTPYTVNKKGTWPGMGQLPV